MENVPAVTWIQRWQLTIAVLAVLGTCAKVIFTAAISSTHIEEKVTQIDDHLKYDDQIFVRKDVLEERLGNFEKAQAKQQQNIEEQNKMLQQIEIELQRKR